MRSPINAAWDGFHPRADFSVSIFSVYGLVLDVLVSAFVCVSSLEAA